MLHASIVACKEMVSHQTGTPRLLELNDLSTLLNEHIFKEDKDGFAHVRTQLGVQSLVIFNDYSDGGTRKKPRWKVLLQKRSPDVSSSPNHFQFIPSGGFESHQTYRGAFDEFTRALLASECNLQRGLMREFAEEVLN